jgi:hypothetical protein
MNDWFVEFKIRERDGLCTPVDPVISIQPDFIPEGNFWGPYHCCECAKTCANFGKTERQAWEIEHGTDDQSFFGFLGSA